MNSMNDSVTHKQLEGTLDKAFKKIGDSLSTLRLTN